MKFSSENTISCASETSTKQSPIQEMSAKLSAEELINWHYVHSNAHNKLWTNFKQAFNDSEWPMMKNEEQLPEEVIYLVLQSHVWAFLSIHKAIY